MRILFACVAACMLVACGGGSSGQTPAPQTPAAATPTVAPTATASPNSGVLWKPSLTDSFQWILSAAFDTSVNASVYDVDMFGTTAAQVAQLHALGRHAVCYIDVGSYENFRPDAASFPSQVLGNVYVGYPNERWLDIRRIDLLAPIMTARFDLCKSKGFDAVEPDNVDGYQNATGFPLTASDQLTYNTWIASLAHQRGLSVGLKNDGDQVSSLEPLFDFALEESCWVGGTCAALAPFHADGKAVITVEYTDVTSSNTFLTSYCPQAKALGYYALLKNPSLDVWAESCP
ncbi:MAG: endo alpha-1,4 polygalactosaminidase [Vulcanimicrobiaceae bacterium]